MWIEGLPGRYGCWIGLTADDAVARACLRDDGLRTLRAEGIRSNRDRSTRAYGDVDERPARSMWALDCVEGTKR